ncbi:MAG: hypothetical protein Q7N50_08280, partial [Armatimonadota bacterium]|nr:hypothetical protein [Armatimonadota bacterium]
SITTATNEGVGAAAPTPGPAEPITGTEASHTATASRVHGFQAEVRHADFAAEQSPATGFQAEVRAVDNAIPEPRTAGFQAEVRAVDNAIPESRTTGFQAEVRAVDNAIPEPRTTGFQAEVRQVDEALKTASVTPETMPEMPTVGASAHGYEGMMKDLLKHLPDTRPENIPDGSDLAKLYEAKASADPEEVGRAIHRIAMEHKFFTDNTSFRVDVGAHMSADAHGNVLFNGEIQAPAGAHMIPEVPVVSSAYHPETPAAPVAEALPNVTAAEAAEGIVITETPTGPFNVAEPFISPAEAPIAQPETAASAEVQPLPAETVITPDTTVTTGNASESISEPLVETPPAPAAEAAATQTPAPVVEQGFISNQLGLKIPVAESHIYVDPAARDVFAYGGSPVERAKSMLAYLTENPNKVVFAADDSGKYRIPWHLVEGKLTPGAPIRTSGFFGLFSSFMKAPEPEEFAKLIK